MAQLPLLKALVSLRCLQLHYHACHNVTHGPSFVGDHGLFADFYGQAETAYDRVAEFLVGKLGREQLASGLVVEAVADRLKELAPEGGSVEDMLRSGLELESELEGILEELDEAGGVGLKNLVGDLAEQIEVRRYKINQRLA